MCIWLVLLIVFVAGAIGGLVNAILTDNGFVMPKRVSGDRGQQFFQPGFFGNVIIGGIAACVSWGLYGPFANVIIAGPQSPETQNPGLTVSALVGAILIGIGGAKWLTDEVDKNLLRSAATEAAASNKSEELARELSTASPVAALQKAVRAAESAK